MPTPLEDPVARECAVCGIVGLTTAKLGAFCFAVYPWCVHHAEGLDEQSKMVSLKTVSSSSGLSANSAQFRRTKGNRCRQSTRVFHKYKGGGEGDGAKEGAGTGTAADAVGAATAGGGSAPGRQSVGRR